MQVLMQLLATHGPPVLLRRSEFERGGGAVVVRLRFGGGPVEVDATDAARVTMSLWGGESVRWVQGGIVTRRRIEAGSVSVVSPWEPPRIHVHGPSDVVHVLLEPALIETVSERRFRPMATFFDTPHDGLRRPLSQAFVAATRGGVDDGLLLGSALHEIAEQAVDAGSRSAGPGFGGLSSAGLRRVEDLIRDRLDRAPDVPLRLDELANAAGLSRHHFIKAFRHSVGITPYAYALRRRLQRSMGLLAGPATSVAEVADMTGFNSAAHFVSCFRRHVGVTPGAFRVAVLS